jgi:hypothetical protein
MIGFRVFDVGLLIAWLIWFLRVRDDEDGEPPDDDGGGGGGDGRGPRPGRGPGGGGVRLPIGRWPAGWRRRDGHRPARAPRRHTGPLPAPARVRSPQPRVPLRSIDSRGASR